MMAPGAGTELDVPDDPTRRSPAIPSMPSFRAKDLRISRVPMTTTTSPTDQCGPLAAGDGRSLTSAAALPTARQEAAKHAAGVAAGRLDA